MYHYTECGLENVWLENGYIEHDTPYGKGVSVANAEQLHEQIAKTLVDRGKRVTGKELRFLRCLLGLSQANFGKAAGVSEQSVSLWERTGKVPKNADFTLKMLVIGKLEGNRSVTDALAAVSGVDRVSNQRIVARETRAKGWKTTLRSEPKASKTRNDSTFALAA